MFPLSASTVVPPKRYVVPLLSRICQVDPSADCCACTNVPGSNWGRKNPGETWTSGPGTPKPDSSKTSVESNLGRPFSTLPRPEGTAPTCQPIPTSEVPP